MTPPAAADRTAPKLSWVIATKSTLMSSARAWPSADYATGDAAVRLRCDTEYSAATVREGTHPPIRVIVARWAVPRPPGASAFDYVTLRETASTLADAKKIAAAFIAAHPDFWPPAVRA